MGAVAAAVLGAPISTTLIVFELTGDWQTGLAVMVAVSTSTAISGRLVDRSFFLTQLERRDVHLAAGPQAYLLSVLRCGRTMRTPSQPGCPTPDMCDDLIARGIWVREASPLETAMALFENTGGELTFIPVIRGEPGQDETVCGALFHVDALAAYNRALADTAAEEHS
jgi:CIC family chloride channel protein